MSRDEYYQIKSETESEMRGIEEQVGELEGASQDNLELGLKVFELAQSLPEQFLKADPGTKRRFLEIICLNLEFDGERLYPTYRKPFCFLSEVVIAST